MAPILKLARPIPYTLLWTILSNYLATYCVITSIYNIAVYEIKMHDKMRKKNHCYSNCVIYVSKVCRLDSLGMWTTIFLSTSILGCGPCVHSKQELMPFYEWNEYINCYDRILPKSTSCIFCKRWKRKIIDYW